MLELKEREIESVAAGFVPNGQLTQEQVSFLNSLPDGTTLAADLFFPPSGVNTLDTVTKIGYNIFVWK